MNLNLNLDPQLVFILTAAVLFFVLSPGVLVTIPPSSNCGFFIQLKKNKYCSSSYTAVAVHTLIYAIALFGLLQLYKLAVFRRLFN